jgi:ankyrin repeat protein
MLVKRLFGWMGLVCLLGTIPVLGQDLHDAARKGDVARIQELVTKEGVDLDATDPAGMTALHYAALGGNEDVVQRLCDLGAQTDLQNSRRMTPAFLAAMRGHNGIVKLLLDKGADIRYLEMAALTAAYNRNKELLEILLHHGMDANVRPMHQMTPLHAAANFGLVDWAEMLVEHGADVNAREKAGRTALLISAVSREESPEFISCLLQHGADPNIPDSVGRSPLLAAAANGYSAVARILIENGAALDYRDPNTGCTALHVASGGGFSDLVKMLLDRGLGDDAPDTGGRTALDYARRYGNDSCAKLLAASVGSAGADETAPPAAGVTAATGQARLWYLRTRGWAVETSDHLLIFDNEESGRLPDEPGLSNGIITDGELAGRDVWAIYTCYHGEPGEAGEPVHRRAGQAKGIHYIHYAEDQWRGPEGTNLLKSRDRLTRDGLDIIPIQMNISLGYLVKVDGVSMFYSGFQPEPDKLAGELAWLRPLRSAVDILFLSTNNYSDDPEGSLAFAGQLIDELQPRAIVLTNQNGYEYRYRQIAAALEERLGEKVVVVAERPGDRWLYEDGTVRH